MRAYAIRSYWIPVSRDASSSPWHQVGQGYRSMHVVYDFIRTINAALASPTNTRGVLPDTTAFLKYMPVLFLMGRQGLVCYLQALSSETKHSDYHVRRSWQGKKG